MNQNQIPSPFSVSLAPNSPSSPSESTVKQGPELWVYDGEKILILRSTFSGAHHREPLLLVDEIEVPSNIFLSCLTQVGPNEIWGGTGATGTVIGWEIDTRLPLSDPILGEEDAHNGTVSSLGAPMRAFGAGQKASVIFSGSSDGTLKLFWQSKTKKELAKI